MVAISTGAAILGGAALSGLLGMGSSAMSSGLSLLKSKQLAEHQAALNYQYAEKSARNQPTWNRAGLEAAGFNPMLAVQNSTSGANSSWASPQDGSVPDFSNSLSAGIANAQSFQRLANETRTAESTVKMNEATGRKAISEAITNEIKNSYLDEREKSEISNIQKDSLLKEAQINNIDETTKFIEKEYELKKLLGFLGYDASIYGSNASSGAIKEAARIQAKTAKEIADEHSPSGKSESFKNYMFGGSAALGSILGLTTAGVGAYQQYLRNIRHFGF